MNDNGAPPGLILPPDMQKAPILNAPRIFPIVFNLETMTDKSAITIDADGTVTGNIAFLMAFMAEAKAPQIQVDPRHVMEEIAHLKGGMHQMHMIVIQDALWKLQVQRSLDELAETLTKVQELAAAFQVVLDEAKQPSVDPGIA